MTRIHQLGCPKEADPRNEVCGCEDVAMSPRGWESVGSAPGILSHVERQFYADIDQAVSPSATKHERWAVYCFKTKQKIAGDLSREEAMLFSASSDLLLELEELLYAITYHASREQFPAKENIRRRLGLAREAIAKAKGRRIA